MIHKRPETDTKNPPGQIVNPIPDPITERNIEQWKKWEEARNKQPSLPEGCTCLNPRAIERECFTLGCKGHRIGVDNPP